MTSSLTPPNVIGRSSVRTIGQRQARLIFPKNRLLETTGGFPASLLAKVYRRSTVVAVAAHSDWRAGEGSASGVESVFSMLSTRFGRRGAGSGGLTASGEPIP